MHQASPPHCLAADNMFSKTKIIPSGCSQGSLNTEYHCYKTVKVLKKPVPTLRQHICLDRKKFHAPAPQLSCCCRWYRQKLTVATFSRCLWRLEKILVDRHQSASCYGTHPALINYTCNYLHFYEHQFLTFYVYITTNISSCEAPGNGWAYPSN